MAHFDLWVICGRVETCKGHAPIALAKVERFNKDFTQDDSLGTATTDNNGHFVLYYRTQDFTKTPFSPLINLELQHGPDVYFRAELAGQPIIEESRLVGLQTGRRNVPRCAQVTLCTERVDPTSPESTPHWELIEDFDVDAQIDANGFAGTKKYVFCDVVKMRGNMPLLNVANNKPLKYRFMVGAYKWPGAENPAVLPTIPPTDVELAPVPAAAINGVVGMLYYTDSDATEKATAVHLGPADVDADGCVQLLGKVVSVQLSDMTTQLIALSTTNFVDYDVLEQINFSYLEKPGTNTGTVENFANPGAAVPAAQRAPTRRYKLVFQVYDNDQTPTQVHATKVLNAAVIDSSAVKVGLMLTELESNLCQKITDEVHIKYTIDHPHLDDFKVEISKNSGVQHPAPPLPDGHFAGNISFRGGQSAPGGAVVDVSGDPSCAYRCRLSFDTRHYDSSRGAGRHVELLYAK